MLRIALRVRLRLRSAQDDTEGEKSVNFKEQSLRHFLAKMTPPFAQGRRRVAFASKQKMLKPCLSKARAHYVNHKTFPYRKVFGATFFQKGSEKTKHKLTTNM